MSDGYVCHVNERIEGAVYIGREYRRRGYSFDESPLRNPFVIEPGYPRSASLMDYRAMTENRFRMAQAGNDFGFTEALIAARGKPLACWCRKSTAKSPACHGDVILELLGRYTEDELRGFVKAAAVERARGEVGG